MTKEIILTKIYATDRNFIELMKRRLKEKSYADTINRLLKEFRRHKLHLDMEVGR